MPIHNRRRSLCRNRCFRRSDCAGAKYHRQNRKHDLSDEQISAIAGAGHNTLVLAGAGTGKTTTIVGYIAWLLNTGTATPEEILVLSFTKASADEMSSRIMQKHRQSHPRMHVPQSRTGNLPFLHYCQSSNY